MPRWWLVLFVASAPAAAFPTLERLFARPYVWGTSPEQLTWARNADVLVFTWNAEESHGFVRDETWTDALRRTTEWFRLHLK